MAESGTLDVITGFQVVEDHFRCVVFEGLGSGGMARLRAALPREQANDEAFKILQDPTARFRRRFPRSVQRVPPAERKTNRNNAPPLAALRWRRPP